VQKLANDRVMVLASEDGRTLRIVDLVRGTVWEQDGRSLFAESTSDRATKRESLRPCGAKAAGAHGIEIDYETDNARARLSLSLRDDGVVARMPLPEQGHVTSLTLPGSFVPVSEPRKYLLPIMQGMLWDGRGEAFELDLHEAWHMGFSMPMFGCMGSSGALLTVAETADDLTWWLGKDREGRSWCTPWHRSSLGAVRYERAVCLYPTDAGIVAVAKRYRRLVRDAGRFLGWEEKIEARPSLERLFGALMCFIGYCRDDVDYAAACRKLKSAGFERALVYPARFNVYHPGFAMGGLPPIDVSEEQIRQICGLGYDIAPWTWLNEGLDREDIRSAFRKEPTGRALPHWEIDGQQWYLCCSSTLPAAYRKSLGGAASGMTWDHFDVITCATVGECYAADHPGHAGHAEPRTEDRAHLRKLLHSAQFSVPGGKAISSESFNDAYSRECDIMSVKAWPQYGAWLFWPVPLTMLVYHDSIIHSWWEQHSYNNHQRGRINAPFYQYGGGRARTQAALDALTGSPPDVFPFGTNYAYDAGEGSKTYAYRMRLEDPEVQFALATALPVAQLHRRIGKQEMVHFDFLSEDGYVQESAFADGTHIVANFANCARAASPALDAIHSESWAEAR